MAASDSVTLRESVTDGWRLGWIGNWVPGHGVRFTLPTRVWILMWVADRLPRE